MSPFLIHDYPKWAEVTIRVLRIMSYGFAANTGLGALLYTPSSIKPETYAIVGSMLVFGLVCMVASIMKRYIVEWVALFFLVGGISSYVAAVWVSALFNNKAIAGASIFTVLVLLMLIRLIDLTVYWRRNLQAAKLTQEMDNDA